MVGGLPAVAAAWWAGNTLQTKLGIVPVVLGALGLAAKTFQGRYKDRTASKQDSPLDLTACLHIVRAALLHQQRIANTEENRAKLRVTIHEVIDESETVEQIVPYVGQPSDPKLEVGRRHSKRSGTVGRAINTGAIAVMHRKSDAHEDYAAEVCKDWAMPRDEAEQLAKNRWSFMAVPLLDSARGDKVSGVVFFDSSEKEFFNATMRNLAGAACTGIAEYVKARYKK